MKAMKLIPRVTTILFLTATAALAADWPQLLGTNQDGISPEKISVWPPAGLKLAWKVPNCSGWGSFVISGNKAFTLISKGKDDAAAEVCIALDVATGKELWATEIKQGVKFETRQDHGKEEKGGYGPGSTPVINDGKVYVYSFDMDLCCFDAQTGKELWRVDVMKDHDGVMPQYGNTESPVVEGDEVIVGSGGPGQFVLGFNKNTGKVIWKTEEAINQQSTPLITTIHGVRQVVFYTKNDLMGISLKDHKTLWRSAVGQHNGHGSMVPVAFEDKVYAGSYTEGTGVYQVIKEEGGFHSKRLWFNLSKDSGFFNTSVLKDGYLYGNYGGYGDGFQCIEFATGKVMWKQRVLGFGGAIVVGEKLVYLSEHGSLILAEAKPVYKELARFDKAIEGKCWSTPAFSNGRLYIRSNKAGACYDLSGK